MKILNKEIEFSFSNADNLEKLENAVEIAQGKLSKVGKNQKPSEEVREIYNVISECFDNIFGEGFAKKIFDNKVELKLCVKAFNDLVIAKNEQETALDNEIELLKQNIELAENKYSPKRAKR